MKAVGYTRVSTDEQAESGLGLASQTDRIGDYCRLKGFDLAQILSDEGLSAKDMKRPALQELLNMVKSGGVEVVVIYKLDRLTRSLGDLVDLIDLFGRKNVELASVTESLDTSTANGKMLVHMIGMLAEWERGVISERTVEAFRAKRARGEPLNGRAPYGYLIEDGLLVEDPDQMKVVREIQVDCTGPRRCSYSGKAKQLNKRGVLSKLGGQWGSKTVRDIALRDWIS